MWSCGTVQSYDADSTLWRTQVCFPPISWTYFSQYFLYFQNFKSSWNYKTAFIGEWVMNAPACRCSIFFDKVPENMKYRYIAAKNCKMSKCWYFYVKMQVFWWPNEGILSKMQVFWSQLILRLPPNFNMLSFN